MKKAHCSRSLCANLSKLSSVSFEGNRARQPPNHVVQEQRLELGAKGPEAGVLVEPEVGQPHQPLQEAVLALQRPLVELRHLLHPTRAFTSPPTAAAAAAATKQQQKKKKTQQQRTKTLRMWDVGGHARAQSSMHSADTYLAQPGKERERKRERERWPGGFGRQRS